MIAIVLRGPGLAGKSATIRMVFNRLRKLYPNPVIFALPKLKTQICHVLSIKKDTVGILSIGDRVEDIRKRLPLLLNHSCNKIVCVARDTDSTWTYVQQELHQAGFGQIVELNKIQVPDSDPAEQERQDNLFSDLIIEHLDL
jgi:hypothetical protein